MPKLQGLISRGQCSSCVCVDSRSFCAHISLHFAAITAGVTLQRSVPATYASSPCNNGGCTNDTSSSRHLVDMGIEGSHVEGMRVALRSGTSESVSGGYTATLSSLSGASPLRDSGAENLKRARCLGMFQLLRPTGKISTDQNQLLNRDELLLVKHRLPLTDINLVTRIFLPLTFLLPPGTRNTPGTMAISWYGLWSYHCTVRFGCSRGCFGRRLHCR